MLRGWLCPCDPWVRLHTTQGLVLLENDGALPLKPGGIVAVVGPMAVETTGLLSDYAAWGPQSPPPSIADAIAAANQGGRTLVEVPGLLPFDPIPPTFPLTHNPTFPAPTGRGRRVQQSHRRHC